MPLNAGLDVEFVLLEHFSLLTFTAAADALATANLVSGDDRYAFRTLSLAGDSVLSDIGITLRVDRSVAEPTPAPSIARHREPLVLICGGYRCSTQANRALSLYLMEAQKRGCRLGGLWNGSLVLADAGLMNGHGCSLHPNDHAKAHHFSSTMTVRSENRVIDGDRLSASGPAGAFELMLSLIARGPDPDTVLKIRRILKADAGVRQTTVHEDSHQEDASLPDALQRALKTMRGQLDKPIDRNQLASHTHLSPRALERLFATWLGTSPARYHRRIRLRHAHDYLLRTDLPVGVVGERCGFASQSHFSRAFTEEYGISPARARRAASTLLDL